MATNSEHHYLDQSSNTNNAWNNVNDTAPHPPQERSALFSVYRRNRRRTCYIDGQKSTKNSETNLTKCYARTTSHSVHTTAGARPARRLRPVVRAAQATRS